MIYKEVQSQLCLIDIFAPFSSSKIILTYLLHKFGKQTCSKHNILPSGSKILEVSNKTSINSCIFFLLHFLSSWHSKLRMWTQLTSIHFKSFENIFSVPSLRDKCSFFGFNYLNTQEVMQQVYICHFISLHYILHKFTYEYILVSC